MYEVEFYRDRNGKSEILEYLDELKEKDEMGKMTYFIYDSDKINLLKKAQPLNGTDVYSSSANQNNFAITSYVYYTGAEALSQTGKTIYGLLKTETDPAGGVTTYTYDAYGYVASIKNPLNKTITYTNNKLGWIKQEKTAKNYTTNNYYDRNGNLLKKILANNETERYLYNFRNQITQKIEPKQYASGSDSATYSTENILSSTSSSYSATAHGYRYTYNTQGLLTKETDPLGYEINYTYDGYGRNLTKTLPDAGVYQYSYDVMDRLTREH
ncbi:MAG: hypothetical protein LBK69_00510, partial [Syntrophomonadaceae bacterium]|nr:hypothetical protein [Syntrophomonadaceae bacterium]